MWICVIRNISSGKVLNAGNAQVVGNIYQLNPSSPRIEVLESHLNVENAMGKNQSEQGIKKLKTRQIGNTCEGHDKLILINTGREKDWHHEEEPRMEKPRLATCLMTLSKQARLLSLLIALSVARCANLLPTMMTIQNPFKSDGSVTSVTAINNSLPWAMKTIISFTFLLLPMVGEPSPPPALGEE